MASSPIASLPKGTGKAQASTGPPPGLYLFPFLGAYLAPDETWMRPGLQLENQEPRRVRLGGSRAPQD